VEGAHLELLRRLVLSDPETVRRVLSGQVIEPPLLDEKTSALVRLAALAAIGGSVSAYQAAMDDALASGAEDDEAIDVVLSLSPVVGFARVNTAARTLGTALGIDIEEDPREN
jgi:4-carboxymuconolactone decarboxylase